MTAEKGSGYLNIEDASGIKVYLVSDSDKMVSMFLPYPAEGRYFLKLKDREKNFHKIFFDGHAGEWFAYCVQPFHFTDTFGNTYEEENISRNSQKMIMVSDSRQQFLLLSEKANKESSIFHNYAVRLNSTITIGRLDDNDIVVKSSLISRHHAILFYSHGTWEVSDKNSTNGVFVNGSRIEKRQLSLGDTIFVMGLQIIIGNGYISINDGNGRVFVKGASLERANEKGNIRFLPLKDDESRWNTEPFNRYPRHRTAFNTSKIEFEAPPMPLNGDKIPLLLRMGNPIMMGASSLMYGNFMMLGTMLFPMITQGFSEKQKKEYEQRRQSKYTEYLQSKADEIQKEKKKRR